MMPFMLALETENNSISGLVVEYIVAIDVTRVRFPADALFTCVYNCFIVVLVIAWCMYGYFKSDILHILPVRLWSPTGYSIVDLVL